MPILETFYGRKYDDIVRAYISAFNPSSIRTTTNGTSLDFVIDRVTVYLDKENKITLINKESRVELPDGINSGRELTTALYEQ